MGNASSVARPCARVGKAEAVVVIKPMTTVRTRGCVVIRTGRCRSFSSRTGISEYR